MTYKYTTACLKASLVATFLLIVQAAPAQTRFTVLDKFLEEKKAILGRDFSMVLVSADTILYQKVIGDVPARTTSELGASSQWLTTALILQLVDEGKISLDDPVAKYLPIFETYRRSYVTIRHCLTHQTGLGKDAGKGNSPIEKTKASSLEERVADLLKKEIHANAGEQFRYTAFGPVIAARVAEVVTKKKFDMLMRTRLFVPLGMRQTTFSTVDGSAPDPAAGAKSTAADLARFLQMILNQGQVKGKQILSAASVSEMSKIQVSADAIRNFPKGSEGLSFALGIWAEGNNGTAPVMSLPNGDGVYPLVNVKNGYAFVLVPKETSKEPTPSVYIELQKLVATQSFKK